MIDMLVNWFIVCLFVTALGAVVIIERRRHSRAKAIERRIRGELNPG
jgi:hypothetical protein